MERYAVIRSNSYRKLALVSSFNIPVYMYNSFSLKRYFCLLLAALAKYATPLLLAILNGGKGDKHRRAKSHLEPNE